MQMKQQDGSPDIHIRLPEHMRQESKDDVGSVFVQTASQQADNQSATGKLNESAMTTDQGEAEVDDLKEVVLLATRVLGKMLLRALSLLASRLVAGFRNETLPLAPGEDLVNVSALAALVGLVAVDELLGTKLDVLSILLADSVLNGGQ